MSAIDHSSLIFLVGSVNKPGPWFHPSGEGITVYSLEDHNGAIQRIAGFPEAENAIWLTTRPGGILLATERFTEAGEIRSFDFDGLHRLEPAGLPQPSGGGAVCHIAIHPVQPVVFVSSFLGGLTVHAVDENYAIAPTHQLVMYTGRERHPTHGHHPMQEGSHPHQATVTPDGKYLLVCDLGSDTIWQHEILVKDGNTTLGPATGVEVPIGSGPRHLVFHPQLPVFYLLGQLNAQVYVYEYTNGVPALRTSHRCLSEDFGGDIAAAAIKFHPSQKALYVSERESNTITVFAVADDGGLRKTSSFSAMGKTPRDFLISPEGNWMIVLNQDSDTIVPFRLDPVNGVPRAGDEGIAVSPQDQARKPVTAGCPVCGSFWNGTITTIRK